MRKPAHKFILLPVLLTALALHLFLVQRAGAQLVITEAKVDTKNEDIWIEVTNPSNTSVLLKSMSVSGVKTPNILPPEIRRQNGIQVNTGERLVICANCKAFALKYGREIKAIQASIFTDCHDPGIIK